MNVCLLNDSFPPVIDGVSNATLNYAKVIERDLGHCVVATPEVPGAVDDYEFPVLRYPSLNTTRLMGYRTGLPFEISTLYRLASGKPDIIHCHCPAASALLARSLRDVTGAPVVLTYHTKFDVDIQNAIRGKLLREVAVKALVDNVSACDEIWAVSRGAGENLRSLGYEGEWRVMENGVDLKPGRASDEQIRRVTEAFDLPAGVPVYLFVGRLMWYKGIRLILEGLRRFGEPGRDFRMVFVGAGSEEEEIRDFVTECGLDDRTVFAGKIMDREALRAWYCRAELFLFPSAFDTNGLVVREAAACGLPSLLLAGSCAAEGVTDGRNGVLIRDSAEDLAEALQRLTPEKLRELGENAQAELYLSWEESIRRAWERYGELLEEWKSGRRKRHPVQLENLTENVLDLRDAMERVKERIGDSRIRMKIKENRGDGE